MRNILQSTTKLGLSPDFDIWVDIMECGDINDLKEFLAQVRTIQNDGRRHRIVQVLED